MSCSIGLLLATLTAASSACTPPTPAVIDAATEAERTFQQLRSERPAFPEELGAIAILWRDDSCLARQRTVRPSPALSTQLAQDCRLVIRLKPGTAKRYRYLLKMPIQQRQPDRIALIWLAPSQDRSNLRQHILVSDRHQAWQWQGPLGDASGQQFGCRSDPWRSVLRW